MTGALRSDATALGALVALLGPERGAEGPTRRYAVLPSPRRPRYVVPTKGRSAGGATLRPGTSPTAGLVRLALQSGLRLGGARLLPGAVQVHQGTADDPGLRRHLTALLGADDLELAVALGGPRPNRKPVIQLLRPDGSTLAWAKVGVDAHTDALVAHETEALRSPPGPPIVTPQVRASGTWQGHPLLVLDHMELDETPGDLDITVAAIEALAGPVSAQPATSGGWWHSLRERAAVGVDPDGAVTARLDALADRLGDRTWPFARWHGDLAPWNATWDGDRLLVWDWERSGSPVPLGLDLVHNRLQVALLREGRALHVAAAETATREADRLVALGFAPEEVGLVVEAYLATLRVRYAEDALLGSLGPGAAVAAALDATPSKEVAHP